jgi:hypothetical protein
MNHKPNSIPLPDHAVTHFARIVKVANHTTPHPFVIGPRHVAYASDHRGGILDEAAISASGVPCQAHGCRLPFEKHITETGAHVEITRRVREAELAGWLTSLKPWAERNGIDGFAFVRGYDLIERKPDG